jgi:hypothetical protein
MLHVIERARTGRAKCRGCGANIAAGERRFGERLPNPFADDDGGEMTHWFHVACAAFMRPEAFLETLPGVAEADAIDDRPRLEHEARLGAAHRRLPRATAVGRAPTARAACRACREPIDKGAWRIALVYYEEGRFVPSGFIHLTCVAPYLETTEVLGRLKHFTPSLTDAELTEIQRQIGAPAPS